MILLGESSIKKRRLLCFELSPFVWKSEDNKGFRGKERKRRKTKQLIIIDTRKRERERDTCEAAIASEIDSRQRSKQNGRGFLNRKGREGSRYDRSLPSVRIFFPPPLLFSRYFEDHRAVAPVLETVGVVHLEVYTQVIRRRFVRVVLELAI